MDGVSEVPAGAPGRPEIHHSHRDVTGGWLRPAVFGAMDGLVSNFALLAGVAGGGASSQTLVLAGLAGLASGAFSMAAGEYVSVRSQAELAHAELEVERREIARRPEAEQAELAMLYERRGLDPALAAEVARQLSAHPEVWRVHAREEFGVDPDELPSPLLAGGSSFAAFAAGALLPVLPYLLGAVTLWPALLVAAVGLFAAGAFASRFTISAWWYAGARQLLLGGLAAAITYGVGSAVGAGLG